MQHGIPISNLPESGIPNFSPLQYSIFTSRFSKEVPDILSLNKDFLELPSPFLLPDLGDSVLIIRKAISENKHILLYGDRDTDGVSSTSLLTIYLREKIIGTNSKLSFLSSSVGDDYGLCPPAMMRIRQNKPDVLITLDFGTSNYDEINSLAKEGIKIIVLDHHEIPVKIPDCKLVNPKRTDSIYPEKKICTSVLSMKFIFAMEIAETFFKSEREKSETLFFDESKYDLSKLDYKEIVNKSNSLQNIAKSYTDLAAVGTITDMMPLTGENRTIVREGLKSLGRVMKGESKNRKGLSALLKNLKLNPDRITSKDLGWGIGPVLNAAGRMGKTETALQLLVTEDSSKAELYCNDILNLNKERKERTKRNLDKVERYFNRKPERQNKKIIFCYEPDLEPGVSGIVATKLVETYKRPVVFVTPDSGNGRGSVRSYGKENVLDLLTKLSSCFMHFGGHPEAGGFSIELKKIPLLESSLEEVSNEWPGDLSGADDEDRSDFEIVPKDLTEKLYIEISYFEPFGQGNFAPVLSLKDVKILNWKPMSEGQHAKFIIQGASPQIKFVVWGRAKELESLISSGKKIDLFGNLEENFFNGNTTVQFAISHFQAS